MIKISTPLGKDELLLQSFRGEEAISKPFSFDLQLHSQNRSIDFKKVIGNYAVISMVLADGSERYINGIINSFLQGGASKTFAYYHATLVPWLWLLTRTTDCRIFQKMTVPDIIQKIFKEYQFHDFEVSLHGSYEEREYCVQYRETDFNFVSRLMEEEGIFYFFKHEPEKHTLVLADTPNAFKPCPHQPVARYELTAQDGSVEDVINEWNIEEEVRPGRYTIKDFNFEKPRQDLTTCVDGKAAQKYEIYDYPGEYAKIDGGERLVGIRMEEESSPGVIASGLSNCRAFMPGYRFKLKDHYRPDLNTDFAITSVTHSADQGVNYESSDSFDEFRYENSIQCIPHPTPFRPLRTTPVPVVHGTQTAIVVGPSGEEIYVDKYGRVKVQFHWDREGKYDEKSSCWIRVSQNWAGKRWGAMFIPRIGQEVIVDFLEGDPDRPIITGRVYNGDSMPPYALPEENTKSTIKTYSSKGGEGFNELRFEDKKGEEQVFIHGEKDLDVRIKHDRREFIGRDRHLVVTRDKREQVDRDGHVVVKRDLVEEVKRDHHLTIDGKEAIKITGSHSLSVTGDVIEEFKGNHSEQVTANYYLKGMQVVVEAMTGLTFKVGGNFITIDPSGIQIMGTAVLLNSGGAPLTGTPGSLVSPVAAAIAEIADKADPGEAAEVFTPGQTKPETFRQQRASLSPAQLAAQSALTHDPTDEENQDKTSWIEIVLTDETGKPAAGEAYRVTLPDGTHVAEGTLDEKGFARVENIDPGNCKVTFPNLDKEAWERN